MRKSWICLLLIAVSCSSEGNEVVKQDFANRMYLDAQEAERLKALPLDCIDIEFPNKLGQVIGSADDLHSPQELHPAFYGCFDWHSAVHGHWSLLRLINAHPELKGVDEILAKLESHISEQNIKEEINYFKGELNGSYERMYGWAWLLKLTVEINHLERPERQIIGNNIGPLAELIAWEVKKFLPKLTYPIRVGTHTNTAFALTMIYDFAEEFGDDELKNLVIKRAKDYYLNDSDCPLTWEPSGYDFLSPCLEEADIMRRVLSKNEFKEWLNKFLPDLADADFKLEPGIVSDREDGHLVHLDGLNFSRAWCLYGIAETLPEYGHLIDIANKHIQHSLPEITDGNYEGGHWLASFALLALTK